MWFICLCVIYNLYQSFIYIDIIEIPDMDEETGIDADERGKYGCMTQYTINININIP